MRKIAALALAAAVTAAPGIADAFCGFYVSPSDAPLANDATMVALMRDGTRTVISMSNNYKGPLADFAMVVPVPVVLKKEDVKTLPREVFGKLETLTAPRLVEYWEQDPCGSDWGDGIGLGTVGGFGHGSGMGYGGGGGGNYHVKVEAQFAVGEYEVVILSAEESDGLERWLKDNGYKIPDGAAAALAPYVKEQQKFFVAKVDPKKTVKDETGAVVLSPLRFHYESTDFRLPVRLGLLNAQGPQDLVVFTIGRGRYEVANHPNAFAPTNLDVTDEVRSSFRPFYAKLFDATIARTAPDAVVTEYAWTTGSCDPCPSPTAPLANDDLATLGTDVVPALATLSVGGGMGFGGSGGGTVVKMLETGTELQGKLPPEVIKRIVRASFPRFRACYQAGLKKNPSLAGTVSTRFVIDATGAVESASTEKGTLDDAQVSSCVRGVFATLSFPEPQAGKVNVTYPIDFQNDGPPPSPQPIVGSNQLTITRLHTRYTAATLGADLVFRMASPVVGGRELRDAKGAIEKGTVPATVDAFQARYVIRHPWTGPVACAEPKYGRWGGPPAGVEGSTKPTTATKLASAPRGPAVVLAKLVRAGLDDVAAWDQAAGGAEIAEPAKPIAAKHTTTRRSRWRRACHCTVGAPAPLDAEVALPVVALALAAIARRRPTRAASAVRVSS